MSVKSLRPIAPLRWISDLPGRPRTSFAVRARAKLSTPVAHRRLYSLPFRLALATPQPIRTLHLLFGAAWLGQALAAGWISRLLMPGRRLTQFLAICLTLTATSDYLTNNLTALGYNLSALMLLLAVGCSLRYVTRES